MDKAFTNWTWYNKPDIRSPLAAVYLNRMNNGIDIIDDRVIAIDTGKANQSDLLQSLKTFTYNETTGVFTFTYWNGNTVSVDLNIEKIPVTFSMSAQGVITMTTADGTTYTADVGALIKTYSFTTSSDIQFTVTVDASGNKTVQAFIINGAVTADKLEPNYLGQVTTQAQSATASANAANGYANDATYEAGLAKSYAIGDEDIRQGSSVDNARYYAQQAATYGTPRHVIQDMDGTDMYARLGLQFENAQVLDDSTNDRTTVKWIITDSEWTSIQSIFT